MVNANDTIHNDFDTHALKGPKLNRPLPARQRPHHPDSTSDKNLGAEAYKQTLAHIGDARRFID